MTDLSKIQQGVNPYSAAFAGAGGQFGAQGVEPKKTSVEGINNNNLQNRLAKINGELTPDVSNPEQKLNYFC